MPIRGGRSVRDAPPGDPYASQADPPASDYMPRKLGTRARQAAAGDKGVTVTTKGDLQGYSTVPARVPVGANDLPLVADSTQALGVKWTPLPIAGGGTGQATKGAAFDALAPTTTKGDLVAYSTTNARVAVGSNGAVLKANSGATPGVAWLAPAATLATTAPTVNTGVTVPTGAVSYRLVFGDAELVPGADDAAVVTWQVDTGGGYVSVQVCRLGVGLTAGGRDAYCFAVPAGATYKWIAGGGATVGTEAIGSYSYVDV